MKIRTSVICAVLYISFIFTREPLVYRDSNVLSESKQHITVDKERKEKEIVQLVTKAIEHLAQTDVIDACYDFAMLPAWKKGEIFIFVLDANGSILSHGDDFDIMWKSINTVAKSNADDNVFHLIKETAQAGGWLTFQLFKGYKLSYVKRITKDDTEYFIGAGFFPESKSYFAKQLVKKAVEVFNQKGLKATRPLIQDQFGPFVKGDLSLFLTSFESIVIADPIYLGYVGQSVRDLVDQNGEFSSRMDLEVAKSLTGHGWSTHLWRNHIVKNYVHWAMDPDTKKKYYITCSNYPGIGRDTAIELVRKSIAHIKKSGARSAFEDFKSGLDIYVQGPLSIFVFDLTGKCLVNGEYPSLIGQNLIERVDDDGVKYIKAMIDVAKENRLGFINISEKNDYKTLYFEFIDMPDGKFVIGTGYYPSSKAQSVQNLVNKGIELLKTNNPDVVMHQFKNKNGEFWRGDISLFVLTSSGTTLINGSKNNLVWQDFLQILDNKGKNIIEELIAKAKSGGGWVYYAVDNQIKRVYVRAITKQDPMTNEFETYILGSGYYL